MIRTDHAFDDPYLERVASLPHQCPYPQRNCACQNLVPVLRHLHEVALDLKNSVAAASAIHRRQIRGRVWEPKLSG